MRGYILLGIILVFLANDVSAIAIGVNRASVNFDEVLRSGYARAELVVTTDSEAPVSGEILLEDSEASPWLNFSQRNFTFSRESPFTLEVDVRPPSDARIQRYRVNMSILTGELSRSDGSLIGTSTRASLGVPIFLSMTGTEHLACQVGGVTVMDTERGQPLEIRLSIINTGNVRVDPQINVKVRDKLQAQLLETGDEGFGMSVLPTRTEQRSVFFPMDLARDQYWLTIEVPLCGYTGVQTFDVLEAGEVKDDGEFIRIDAASWAKVGDIVPIDAIFRNRGVRSARASFHGTIARVDDGTVVKVVSTEQYIVDPQATAEIETFFNPSEPGQYEIRGEVHYNDKLTAEKSAIVNVNGEPIRTGLSSTKLIIIFLFLAVLLFLILIVRKRREVRRH